MQKLDDGGILVSMNCISGKRWKRSPSTHHYQINRTYQATSLRLAAVNHEAVALRQRLQKRASPAVNWMANKAGAANRRGLAAITLTRSMICDGTGAAKYLVRRAVQESGWTNCAPATGIHRASMGWRPSRKMAMTMRRAKSYIWYKFGGTRRADRVRGIDD